MSICEAVIFPVLCAATLLVVSPAAAQCPLGDANGDGFICEADFAIWNDNYDGPGTCQTGDFNLDGYIDGQDYTIWYGNYAPYTGPSGTGPMAPHISWTQGLLANGHTETVVTVHTRNGYPYSMGLAITFDGQISQMLALGMSVDIEEYALLFDGVPGADYTAAEDTWAYVVDPPDALWPIFGCHETPQGGFYVSVGSIPGSGNRIASEEVLHLVHTGPVSFAGNIGLGQGTWGDDFLVAGVIPVFGQPPPPPGDANDDDCVDGADYTVWADHYRCQPVPLWSQGGWAYGNFNDDSIVDGADYTLWADNYLSGCAGRPVPEPSCAVLLALSTCLALLRGRKTACCRRAGR